MKRWSAAVALLGVLAGCREDEGIRVYQAPKEPRWRMIAAVVPTPGATWFFKAVASSARAEEGKAEIERFLGTLKPEGEEVRWTLPAGWSEEKGAGDRVATLRVGPGQPPLELTVTRLGGDAGGVLANVNRWRGQLGLGAIGEAELASKSTTLDLGAAKAVVVDLEGPRRPSTSGPMSGGGAARPAPPPDHPPLEEGPGLEEVRRLLAYSTPPGWVENPQARPPRLLEFRAGAAVVSLAYLEGNGGGLAANVNRWRGQVGLGALDRSAAEAAAPAFEFMGHDGHAVEAVGDEKAMLVVFRLGPPFSLFLKMDGPKDAVLREKPAFEAFARSVKVNR